MTENEDIAQMRASWSISVKADLFRYFFDAHKKHKAAGPDTLKVVTTDPSFLETLIGSWTSEDGKPVTGKAEKVELSFQTTFAPHPPSGFRCLICEDIAVFEVPAVKDWLQDWQRQADLLTKRNAALGLVVPEPKAGQRVVSIRTEYFRAPGRLFDTPRNAESQGDLPSIGCWYQQTAFNRTCAMAAAALTKTDTRDAVLGWQSATVEEVEDLVYCRSEEGTPAHGQHRFDILKAFEALRAIPIPIVTIDWRLLGTQRNPRWVKQYKLRVASLLQSYGAIFIEKKTGKRVFAADPALRKHKIEAKPDRRKTTRALVAQNPVDSIMESFPPDRFTLWGFEWRWNTDIAEDFICPQVALDEKNRPRLKPKGGRHHEGSRFVNLTRRYFMVQKHLRDAGSKYAPRLLDLIVSERTHIVSRGKGAVCIEIQAQKVIKWLDLWDEYQTRPKHVLEDHIAGAVMALIREKVMLPESWLVPQRDKNPDRRKGEYYRWRIDELWSTLALVPLEQAKDIEAELVAEAEGAQSAQPDAQPEQGVLPGLQPEPPIPSGPDIRAAREAAGLNLRRFAEAMGGPNFSTWSRYEAGRPIRVGNIKPETWQRVRDFVANHLPRAGSEGGFYDG